jgi:hypothetical protein
MKDVLDVDGYVIVKKDVSNVQKQLRMQVKNYMISDLNMYVSIVFLFGKINIQNTDTIIVIVI